MTASRFEQAEASKINSNNEALSYSPIGDANQIHASLQELHAWTGRTSHNIEKDLRDTLATLNTAQIEALNRDYKNQYHVNLSDALNQNGKLSKASKATLAIYMHGAENRSSEDSLSLAKIATGAKNLDMFEEAFRDASPQARVSYLAHGGAAQVKAAFGGVFSHRDEGEAMQYLEFGHLQTNSAIDLGNAIMVNHPGAKNKQEDAKAGAASEKTAVSDRDAFNSARQAEYKSNDGIGRALIRSLWDDSSDKSTDALNQYAAAMARHAAEHSNMSAGERMAYTGNLGASLDNLKNSKNALGNTASDGALLVAGVGAAAFTGGASLALVGSVATGGAAIKIGTKAIVSGSDYQYTAGQILADGATGAATAATMLVGPAQIGRALGAGTRSTSFLTDVALNSGAGAVAGTATGTVEGMTEWKKQESLGANLGDISRTALVRGATGALLAGVLSGTIGAVSHAVRGSDASRLASVSSQEVAQVTTHAEAIGRKFAPFNNYEAKAARSLVISDLTDVKAVGIDDSKVSAYDSLMQQPTLSAGQKENILHNLGLVREHYASFRLGDRMHPDPEINWIHTQGEFAKTIELDRLAPMKANELEDTMLASMYSDSVKFAFPAPEGAVPNFHTHHLDGAIAAERSLRLQGFPQERIDGIVDAILAHQVSPPKFMGQLYHWKIDSTLKAMIKDGKVSAAEGEEMSRTLENMTARGEDGVPRISKIVNADSVPVITAASGRQQVIFSDAEKKVLALSGIDTWTVPYKAARDADFASLSRREQQLRQSRGRIAEKLVEADAVDNYRTTGGASKIVAIRGPKTSFQDKTVWDSIASIDSSATDAYSILGKEGRRLSDESGARLDAVVNRHNGTLKTYMDNWLKTSKGLDPATDNIPFYNQNLAYNGDEKGMQLAEEIRAQVVDFLRRDHRTAGDLPGKFKPVRVSDN